MRLNRIWALMIRYALLVKSVIGRQLLIIYFPAVDIILFGLMGMGFAHYTSANILVLYLTSRVLWTTSMAIYHEMGGNFQVEIEAINLINLFSSPMTLHEWVLANIFNGIIRGLFLFFYGLLLSWLIFGINLIRVGVILLPLIPLLLFSWLPFGILISALYLRYGLNAFFVRWSLPTLLLFLSAVFFPRELLPTWLTPISKILPTSHLFSTLQQFILNNTVDYYSIMIGTLLILVYIILSASYLGYCFKQSKKDGLSRLENI